MNAKPLRVAGTLFGIIALIQVTRLALGWPVEIAGVEIPLWVSGILFVVAAAMTWWMFSSVKHYKK